MPQHIGIVACSAEGASLCYRTICVEGAKLLGPHAHPEVSLHSLSLADYARCMDRGDWQGVADLMSASARRLAEIGADFLICPDNSIHQAMPLVERRSPWPWLHIADVVADEAVRRGYRRVGLTGTRWLVSGPVYSEKLAARGLQWVLPSEAELAEIHRIIMEELVYGVFKPQAITHFQNLFNRMKEQGCDAVILGCTEIPLIMNDTNSPLPTLDSTRLLARAALHRAIDVSTNQHDAATTPRKQSLGLVSLIVRDYDDAIEFFVAKLGFRLIEDSPVPEQSKRWVVVAPPGARETRLLLAKASTPEQEARIGAQTGGRVFLFLYTDNFWRDYELYKSRGVAFVREPKNEPYGTVAVFQDLYGNLWDLLEPQRQSEC